MLGVDEILNRIIYDWVSICFHKHTVAEIVELLGLEELNFQEVKGAHGYRDRFYSDFISIHYNGRPDMGVWLEMSGKGCRAFETFGNGDYEKLFGMCLDSANDMHLTRLDVAYDDFEGILSMRTLCEDVCWTDDKGKDRLKNVVTRFHEKSFEVRRGGKGASVNFGSKKSDIFVRIYDKDAEQGSVEGRHWIRVELQLRDERAEGFVRAAGTVGEKFRGVLANYVRFVVPSEDSNKRRWPTAPYWEKLLGSAEAISVYTKPKADYTIDQLEAFVVRQAGNAISAYIEIRGVNGFLEAVKERHTMPNPKYEALKSKLREPIEKRELSREEIYASGLELARYKDFDKPSQVVDSHGYRWLVCEECGELRRADEMVSYGGWKMNYGVCRACSNG